LGGEEFVLVLPNTRLEEALRTAEQFREAIATLDLTRLVGEPAGDVSIGVTISMPRTDTPSSMLRRADSALYARETCRTQLREVRAALDAGRSNRC